MASVSFKNDSIALRVPLESDEQVAAFVQRIDSEFERAGGLWLVANMDVNAGNQSYMWFPRSGSVTAHFDSSTAPDSLSELGWTRDRSSRPEVGE